tara:strand:- start:704 stop:1048 length:345 start_codon:yes stop_codon:yes gene_type:complete
MPTRAKLVTRTATTSSNSTENLNKGSKLTFTEMDSNFIELQNQSIGIVGDDSSGINISAGETIRFIGAGGATIAVADDTVTITAGGGGGAVNIDGGTAETTFTAANITIDGGTA